jgi:cysteine desulfurase
MDSETCFLPNVIYLDHNATTPVAPEVANVMDRVLREGFGNPSSDHAYGRNARRFVDEARQHVASLLGCDPAEVVFTGGGSESNNIALRGVAESLGDRFGGLVISAVEHPAVTEPARWLADRGATLRVIPVDSLCRVDPKDVEHAVHDLSTSGKTALVSIMHANNEVGAIQPIAEISRKVKPLGALLHTDSAQTVGKIPVDVDELGVDLLSIAAHKFYGPKGVGALYIRDRVAVAGLILGAGHERGLRAGTENVAGMAGLGEACRLVAAHIVAERARLSGLRDALWERLCESIPGIERNGHTEHVLPNTLHVSFPGVSGWDVLSRSPGVAASTGSACHEGDEAPSGVLGAMGLSVQRALGAVRLSLGRWTSQQDVDTALARLAAAWTPAK